MEVLRPVPLERGWYLRVRDDDDLRRLRGWDGSPRSDGWDPIPMVLVTADHRGELEPTDFPATGSLALALSARAADALDEMLRAHGELLPLQLDQGEFYAFNTTAVLDALDMERSELRRFASSGRLMNIERYAFIPAELAKAPIFRLSVRRQDELVTDSFVQRVHAAGLSGFDTRTLWRMNG